MASYLPPLENLPIFNSLVFTEAQDAPLVGPTGPAGPAGPAGPSSTQFVPTFYNFSGEQFSTTTTGYIGTLFTNFSGSWGINDFICYRISQTMTWGDNQSNFAAATGLIYFKPYYIPQSGIWSALQNNSSSVQWANQTGPYYGVNSGVYFVPGGISGNCGYMYIYGDGWGNIQFMAYSPQVQGGFQTTFTLEYLCSTATGGQHQIGGQTNTLP